MTKGILLSAITRQGILIFLLAINIGFFASCNEAGTKKGGVDAKKDTTAIAVSSTVSREITVGGRHFVMTDTPVSRFLYMGKDTALYYFTIGADSLSISTVYISPGGVTAAYETVTLYKNDIDTTESGLNGITLNEGNANEFTIMAKPGKTFQFVSYQQDSTSNQTPATETRLIVQSDSTADRIARLLGISR